MHAEQDCQPTFSAQYPISCHRSFESHIFKDIFPDNDTPNGYASARTKTTCIINGSLAPHFKAAIVETMKNNPFTIAIDGSNDTGLEKMNPMTVRHFDDTQGEVVYSILGHVFNIR